MRDRAEKLRRLTAVQHALKQADETRLLDVERRIAGVATLERELLCALNAEHAPLDLILDATARRLRSLARDAAQLESERVVHARRLLASAARLKAAERLSAAAARDAAIADRKKDLSEIIDDLVMRGDASVP